jgi:hypothetical protein
MFMVIIRVSPPVSSASLFPPLYDLSGHEHFGASRDVR